MKALLIVMAVITLGGALIPVMHAVEASRTEASFTSSESADYVAMMEWAIRYQNKRIEQLKDENAALAVELARVKSVTTNAPATPL